MNQVIKKNSGQSVIEVLVALSIFAVSLAAGFQVFFGGQSLTIDSGNAEIAMNYAQQGADAVKAIRDRNWTELTSGEHVLYFNGNDWMFASSGTSEMIGDFTRTVSIYNEDDNTRIATTTIAWSLNGRDQSISLVEKLTNWESPLQSSCKTEPLSGDWSNPTTIGTGDLGSGNEGTDILVRYPYVYMSGKASSSSKPDIFVFDISTPTAPSLIKSLDIGSDGINSIYIKDDYLYAASSNDSMELMIFNNVSSPLSMSLVGSLGLSGSANAYSVIAFGDTVAIGRDSVATNEVAFINVSNPASPSVISQVTTSGDVYDFSVSDNTLYFVSKESDDDLWMYDITNTASPTLITTHDIYGTTEDLSVFLHYKGGNRNLMVGNEENELVMLGATTTTALYVRDRVNVGGDVNDIVCAVGDLAFLATSYSTAEFTIVNVANPDNVYTYGSLNYPQVGTGIDYYDNKVYMSVRSNDSLRIITSQ